METPNRILKESIRTSKKVNALTDFQFRLWAYLITYVDDYGRGSADPAIIKGFVFPLRASVTEKTIDKALAELANMGILTLYTVGEDAFLCFPNWEQHQTIRNKRSKFPSPEEGEQRLESNCIQLQANVSVIQSNPNPNTNPNPTPNSAEPESASTPEIALPLIDGSEYYVTQEEILEHCKLYPGVDVMQEYRNMRGWCLGNPKNRKTRAGIKRFISGWLEREQNRSRPRKGNDNVSFLDIARMMGETNDG